jgi:hypothetical protein
MGTPEFYRTEAERCRALAARGGDAAVRRRWHQLADEYDQLARTLERTSQPGVQVQAAAMPQPMQQQQSKAEPDREP